MLVLFQFMMNETGKASLNAFQLGESPQKTSLFTQALKDLENEVSKSHIQQSEMKKYLESYLRESNWKVRIQNHVYQEISRTPATSSTGAQVLHCKEPISYIRKAQANWEKRIVKSINSMCTELNLPLSRKRLPKDQSNLSSKFQTLGCELDEAELEKIKPVYAPKDFFEALVSLENPNFSPLWKTPSSIKGWGLIQVQLKTKDLKELRKAYCELQPGTCHCGVDDFAEHPSTDAFQTEWIKLGRKVVHHGGVGACRHYAKYGCPETLRREIWTIILGLEFSDLETLYFEHLKKYVFQYDMLVDSLVTKDIKMTATNDDNYFVFEDLLYQVLLPFTRDTEVLKHFESSSAAPPKSYIRGKLGIPGYAVNYPPNGIIPFHGFAMLVAPICYITDKASQVYFLFREFYCRLFSKLHCISSESQGILSLCVLFENLLQIHEPTLFYHLKEVGAFPLKLVFNWMTYAYSGYLATEQVLILWDRILAYDSLELLAVLAVAVLSYRRVNLMEVTNLQAAQAVLIDISTLNVMALLQYCLFLKK